MELFYNNRKEWVDAGIESSKELELIEPRLEVLAKFLKCEVLELKFAGPEEYAGEMDLTDPKNLDLYSEYIGIFDEFKEKLFKTKEITHDITHDISDKINFDYVKVYCMNDKTYIYIYECGYESITTT